MDADAVRNKPPARTDPARTRNALLAAIVFELAVLAGLVADVSGAPGGVLVAALYVTFLLGAFAGLYALYAFLAA